MAKKTPLLNDFRSGELTPGLGTRSDLKVYSKGCIVMENCMPLIEGGIERIPGTRFVRTVKQTEEGWGLRITKSGSGSGRVTDDWGEIDCGGLCYFLGYADGIPVVLTANPDAGHSFTKWSGDGTGSPLRTVVMNGNKVVDAEFSLLTLPYEAYDMCNSATHLFICGMVNDVADRKCYLERRPLSNPSTLLGQYSLSGISGATTERFEEVVVDDDYVYVCGRAYNVATSKVQGVVLRFPLGDLSTPDWTYWLPIVAGVKSSFHAMDQDADNLYLLGVDGDANASVSKITKGGAYYARATIAVFSSTAEWGGIKYNSDDGFLYMSSEEAGNLAMAKIRASDFGAYSGSSSGSNYLYRNVIVGTNVYGVGGVTGDRKLVTQSRKLSNIATVNWTRTQNYVVNQFDTLYDVVSDGSFLYVTGIFYDVAIGKYRGLTQCIALDGSSAVWTQESSNDRMGFYQGPALIGGYLWLCLYSNSGLSNKVWVEKRDLADGSLIKEWSLY